MQDDTVWDYVNYSVPRIPGHWEIDYELWIIQLINMI